MKTYDEHWALLQATQVAKNSNCQSKRGVVIWHRELGLISSGWNAPPYPLICDGSDSCKSKCSKTAIHAEQAALLDVLLDGARMYDYEMFHVKIVDNRPVVSDKPSCWQCSKLIMYSGLRYMWLYRKEGLTRYTPLQFHLETLKNNDLSYIIQT